jgi:receptor-type tyrosine-protein phosphatase Q
MDLGIVLDASGSVGASNYRLQLNFTKNLLLRLNIGPNKTHAGIINYSNLAEVLTWLNTNYTLDQKLRQVEQATYYSSGTNTALALQRADTVFSYSNGRRLSQEGVTPIIFVITDGKSNDQAATIQAANVLKQKGIVLVSVGVGNGPNLAELNAICTPPASANYFAMSDYNALEQKLSQFTSKSCSEPVSIPSNTTVTAEIGKDKYKFIKVEIIIIGKKILITVKLFNGNVKLFHSFTNRNPKDPADFIDYETKTSDSDPSVWTKFKSYFQRSSTKTGTAKNGEATLVIDKPDDNVDVAYIGIKGIEEENKFEVKFDDCDQVVCPKSSASIMKLSIVLAIISALFIL